jgi:SAM-dependent methyltransferase
VVTRLDFVAYPPTSFPVRDLLVLEQLALGSSDTVCEIGIGSGATAARLALRCAHVTGFEISEGTVRALRYLERRHRNLTLVVADVTSPQSIRAYEGAFSRLVACDTLEHVADASAFFRAVAMLLAPGGEFLVTFPNEPKFRMHGVTRFDDAATLSGLLDSAGLSDHRIAAAKLTRASARVASALATFPIEVVRGLLRSRRDGTPRGAVTPQVFDETHFYKQMTTWKRFSPIINAYWYAVLNLMLVYQPCFVLDAFSDESFADSQVIVLGRKRSIGPPARSERSTATQVAPPSPSPPGNDEGPAPLGT